MENVLAPTTPLGAKSSRSSLWIGRVLSGLVVAFMLVDALGKLLALSAVVDATQKLGYAVTVIRPLGVLLAVATLLHVIPRTQLLGALLLTAYLGGAVATLVRVGQPCWFPVMMGAILWIAYSQRRPDLRALFLSPQAR